MRSLQASGRPVDETSDVLAGTLARHSARHCSQARKPDVQMRSMPDGAEGIGLCYHIRTMMRHNFFRRAAVVLICFACSLGPRDRRALAEPAGQAKASNSSDASSNRPFGIEKRVPWTTSKFRGSPDPPLPYRAARVFPKLHFKNPTVLTNAPGTDRFFVAEQYGKIFSISNDPDTAAADPFLDCAALVPKLRDELKEDLAFEAVYGLTFH